MKPVKYYIGDSCLCWSIGESIERSMSLRILAAYRQIKDGPGKDAVLDIVPSYNALAVHFDPLVCDIKTVEKHIDSVFDAINKMKEDELFIASRKSIIPVVYNGEDLPRLSDMHKISIKQIIEIHKSANYTVAMVGFKPHFPYLIGLDKRLETPRLEKPRLDVPAGSVAIGGAQTGIYPSASPGGWNLIGHTNPGLLKEINPGDTIEFKEVKEL